MGSDWQHVSVKSSLPSLAVSNMGVYLRGRHLKIWVPRCLGVVIKKVFLLHIRLINKLFFRSKLHKEKSSATDMLGEIIW